MVSDALEEPLRSEFLIIGQDRDQTRLFSDPHLSFCSACASDHVDHAKQRDGQQDHTHWERSLTDDSCRIVDQWVRGAEIEFVSLVVPLTGFDDGVVWVDHDVHGMLADAHRIEQGQGDFIGDSVTFRREDRSHFSAEHDAVLIAGVIL